MNPRHDIEAWIPQRPPFVFIDTIVEMNGEYAITQLTVSEECPLVEDLAKSVGWGKEERALGKSFHFPFIRTLSESSDMFGNQAGIKKKGTRVSLLSAPVKTHRTVLLLGKESIILSLTRASTYFF